MANSTIVAVAIALICGPAALAQAYIVPSGHCGTVTLHVSGGDGFRDTGEKIAAARVQSAYAWALPNERVEAQLADDGRSLTFNATVPDDGVLIAGVELKRETIGNESRAEHAKSLLFCGPAAPPADWQRTIGLGLEIYPQGWNGPRPRMKPGDSMRFIAVDKATQAVVPNLAMDLYGAGTRLIARGVPAKHGGMNFPFPEPGRYIVVATYRRPDPQQADHWLVDTSTLSFDVK